MSTFSWKNYRKKNQRILELNLEKFQQTSDYNQNNPDQCFLSSYYVLFIIKPFLYTNLFKVRNKIVKKMLFSILLMRNWGIEKIHDQPKVRHIQLLSGRDGLKSRQSDLRTHSSIYCNLPGFLRKISKRT